MLLRRRGLRTVRPDDADRRAVKRSTPGERDPDGMGPVRGEWILSLREDADEVQKTLFVGTDRRHLRRTPLVAVTSSAGNVVDAPLIAP